MVAPLSVIVTPLVPDITTLVEPDVLDCISESFAPPAATVRLPSLLADWSGSVLFTVILPLTPSPFVTVIAPVPATTERCAQVSAAVRTAIPVPASPSSAERSFARARVGLPETPFPFVTVIPAAGPVNVLVAEVPVPVITYKPVVPVEARAFTSLSTVILVLVFGTSSAAVNALPTKLKIERCVTPVPSS